MCIDLLYTKIALYRMYVLGLHVFLETGLFLLPIIAVCVCVCVRAFVNTFIYGHTSEKSQCNRGQITVD